MPPAKLARISFRDSEREIYVTGYADILVYDQNSHMLVAARFGGYPEAVRALVDAINYGGSIDVEVEDGLKNGHISIPGTTLQSKGAFTEIDGVMDYLEAFGVLIAEKIK